MTRAIRTTEEEYAQILAKRAIHHSVSRAGEEREQADVQTVTGRSYSFTVVGIAQPGGSKQAMVPLNKRKICRCERNGRPVHPPYRRENGGVIVTVVDANPKTTAWRKLVAHTAKQKYAGPIFDAPVLAHFVFYRPRPESHYGAHGLSKQGRENPFPTTKPDALKLARAAEDALTGICWTDDAQIVIELIEKRYGEPARMEVTVEEVLVDTGQRSLI